MVDVAGARVLAILTRAPSAGGKSRLFASLGRAPDPALLAALLLDTLDAATVPEVTRVIAVTPPAACGEVAALVPAGVRVMPQSGGDLGERMQSVFASLFDAGAAMVVLIGSDLPAIDAAAVSTAFERLARDADTLVLGPALAAAGATLHQAELPPVFDGIEWGSERVLERTRNSAARADFRVFLRSAIEDVDTADALFRAATRAQARRTREWVTGNEGFKEGNRPVS